MQMLLHKSPEVCASAAAGIGLEVLKEAISTCEASDKWWEAAQLNYALSTTRGCGAARTCCAWAAVGKMAAETDESRALEAHLVDRAALDRRRLRLHQPRVFQGDGAGQRAAAAGARERRRRRPLLSRPRLGRASPCT